jgi:hypothetical protein
MTKPFFEIAKRNFHGPDNNAVKNKICIDAFFLTPEILKTDKNLMSSTVKEVATKKLAST